MKKLLLLLFSLMLSFNSYGEWTKTNEDIDDNSWYTDFETVNKLDNGYVVFWIMADVDLNNDGYMSSKIYWQGDCNLSRMKILSMIQYKEPMGLGESQSASESELELVGWDYLPPDSIGYDSLKAVCSLADQSSMNNYQSKVLELIAEYESYEWGDDDSSYSSSSKLKEAEAKLKEAEAKLKEAEEKAAVAIKQKELELKNQLEAEIAAQQQAYEKELYNQLLVQEIREEQDLIENQKAKLQSAWIGNIAAEVKSVWNFPGAEPGWFVKVLITQNKEGKVLNVKFGEDNVGNSSQAKAFINSVERAIYKSSPLPIAPDVSVWDKNIMFTFK